MVGSSKEGRRKVGSSKAAPRIEPLPMSESRPRSRRNKTLRAYDITARLRSCAEIVPTSDSLLFLKVFVQEPHVSVQP